MNNKHRRNEISLWQFILTISGVQVGFGLLTFPHELEQVAGTDGWISLLIGGFITILISLCIIKIMAKHPGDFLIDVLTRYMGKWLGKAAMVIWILYCLLGCMSLLFSFIYVIRLWVLPKTPSYAVMSLAVIPAFMLARGGVRIISRYAVFVFFFTIWMPFLLLMPLKESHLLYLLPILKEGWMPILHAAKMSVLPFLGFEFAFILYPYLKQKKSAGKGIVIANIITLVVYLQITFVCFTYFSPDEISQFVWPTLTLVKPIHFTFLERFEIVFLSFFIFIFSDSVIPYFFSATEGINQLFKKERWNLPVYLLLGLIFAVTIFFKPSVGQMATWRDWWGITGYFVCYAFPVVFLLYITGYTYWQRRKT
ncbi:endospore germination permease [Priestia aryabhattai]|uniref:GerAB/ArcD/ProY family transporter n=1 Tax=Priestia aryabhattai TaxID=412384 RepID=UPI001C0BEBE0|nr:endospore germination permease [Priestia aryabhattai]MBU3568794.1 endospore germination permease [Priestia aryabhattai]